MLLKFNNIRDLSDARYAAAMMAEWIGFSIGKIDSLSTGKIQEIIEWCAGPKLILEINEGVGSDVIESYLKVLPVFGLEVNSNDYSKLKSELNNPNIQWIVLDSTEKDTVIKHIQLLGSDVNTISRIDPKIIPVNHLLEKNPWAISIDCEETTETKNFDLWNDFFDAMDVV